MKKKSIKFKDLSELGKHFYIGEVIEQENQISDEQFKDLPDYIKVKKGDTTFHLHKYNWNKP